MDNKLYEASIQGNVTSLLNLLHEDPLIIHKYITKPHRSETPVHIAALLGHGDFVEEILTREPELASELNSEGSTALHLASARGHVDIVRCLLRVKVEMCQVLDRYGMNPVHLAAVKGRVDALREMVQSRPDAARMVTRDGLTILHLCMIYNQLEAMKFLVEVNGGVVDEELVNAKDQDGNTVLHLAVLHKQAQASDLLVTSTRIDIEARNAYGLTASDISKLESSQKVCIPAVLDVVLQERIVKELQEERLRNSKEMQIEKQAENRKNALMIAATVIMSMSFQVTVNPPGGVWQDNLDDSHKAGNSILASTDKSLYNLFIGFNSIAFCVSTFVLLLMLSRLPFFTKNRYVMGFLDFTLWLAILSSFGCFFISVRAITPSGWPIYDGIFVVLAAFVWGILFITHIARHLWKVVIKKCYQRSLNYNKYVMRAFKAAFYLAIISFIASFFIDYLVPDPIKPTWYLTFSMCGFLFIGHVALHFWKRRNQALPNSTPLP